MATATRDYDSDAIQVIEGIEAVRIRPGMYIGGTDKDGFHHLLWEIVDNAIDEVMNGHATRIIVTLHKDLRTVSVADNGRGIPVAIHKEKKTSALELVFTTLHAGGKFDNDAYKVSGGLNGVGASVVNALSSELAVEVKRDGSLHRQSYERGKPLGPVRKVGAARGTGTTVSFSPDSEIFGRSRFDPELIAERLEIKAYLNKGLSITFEDQSSGQTRELHHEGGVADYLTHLHQRRGDTVIAAPFLLERDDPDSQLRVETALAWVEAKPESSGEQIVSFVNTIPTRFGGTHEQGIREAIRAAVLRHMTQHGLMKKGQEVKGEDIREGLTCVLSVCVPEPQFGGQTKDKLNNAEVRTVVESIIRPRLADFLLKNPSAAEAIAQHVLMAARAREESRKTISQVRRKSPVHGARLNLPGKLADCELSDPERSELFIVEGDSAGGSAKMGRDRETQAILPLRGKVLNAEQAGKSKVLDNKELGDLTNALGCGLGNQYDPSKLRYGRVILLTDADSDGHHIATLLLTFFYRHMPGLIRDGRVYLACPPLYKISHGQQTHWAADDAAKDKILAGLPENARFTMTRFKGLGEMTAKLLFETTLDPKRRRLLRVMDTDDDRPFTENTVCELMGRDPEPRFRFIMAEAYTAQDIDI